jgi:hypothetical protein
MPGKKKKNQQVQQNNQICRFGFDCRELAKGQCKKIHQNLETQPPPPVLTVSKNIFQQLETPQNKPGGKFGNLETDQKKNPQPPPISTKNQTKPDPSPKQVMPKPSFQTLAPSLPQAPAQTPSQNLTSNFPADGLSEIKDEFRQLTNRKLKKIEIDDLTSLFSRIDFNRADSELLSLLTGALKKISNLPEEKRNEIFMAVNQSGNLNSPEVQNLIRKMWSAGQGKNSLYNAIRFVDSLLDFHLEVKKLTANQKKEISNKMEFDEFFHLRPAHIENQLEVLATAEDEEIKNIVENLEKKMSKIIPNLNRKNSKNVKKNLVDDEDYSFELSGDSDPSDPDDDEEYNDDDGEEDDDGDDGEDGVEDDGEDDDDEDSDDFSGREGSSEFRIQNIYLRPPAIYETPGGLRKIGFRKNSFENVEEYLKAHFRLLLEDFYRNIRESLEIFETEKKENPKMLPHYGLYSFLAKPAEIFSTREGVSFKIVIKLGRFKRLNPRRFLDGSMVFISRNYFKNFVPCLVRGKNVIDLMNTDAKCVVVELLVVPAVPTQTATNLSNEFSSAKELQIFEPRSFFEAYHHCLLRLQRIKSINMDGIIVYEDPDCVELPEYLQQNSDNYGNRFRRTLNPMVSNVIRSILTKYELDDSQAEAVRHAFSKNLPLIQGPPGTGKTFTSIIIVEILLKLKRLNLLTGPIFVVCFTNHALDQFLSFILNHTDSIVRLGGRCKHENLKKYTLKAHLDGGKIQRAGVVRYLHAKKIGLEKCLNPLSKLLGTSNTFSFIAVNAKTWFDQLIRARNEIVNIHNRQDKFSRNKNDNGDDFGEGITEGDIFYESSEKVIKKILTDDIWDELKILDKIEDDYFQKLESWMKKLNKYEAKDWLKFYHQLLNGIDKFTESMLYWLELIDFDYVYDLFKKHIEKKRQEEQKRGKLTAIKNKSREQDDDNEESEEEDEEARKHFAQTALFMQNNNLMDQARIDSDVSQQPALSVLYGPALSWDDRKPVNIKEAIENKLDDFYLLPEDNYKIENLIGDLSKQTKNSKNIFKISLHDAWQIAQYFRTKINELVTEVCESLGAEIRELNNKAKKPENANLAKELSEFDIIGVTTTGAAKMFETLSKIPSKVTIVEEAAEVLECQIIASMTKSVEHLILIGDHQQLRPRASNMEMAIKYNLEISMFERLVEIGYPLVQLSTQHRMRPEISKLVRPFYDKLDDHKIVQHLPNIRCTKKDIFFFTHNWPESSAGEDGETKLNVKEAGIIIKFAKYLLDQGYQIDDFVILSLYAGQLLYIKSELSKTKYLKYVRVCTVDEFQGEESNIVILSLVRSNASANIGFLKFDNRINVAFSRAKHGMFIFGDSECIEGYYKRNKDRRPDLLLYKILKELRRNNLVSNKIELGCRYHKNFTIIQSEEDFQKCPRQRCTQPCQEILYCGHTCLYPCHDYVLEADTSDQHNEKKCQKECLIVHPCRHGCEKKCGQCKSEPFVCQKMIDFKRSRCGHVFNIRCHEKDQYETKNPYCYQVCGRILGCSHFCQKKCYEVCEPRLTQTEINEGFETACRILVPKFLKCGHEMKMFCGQNYLKYLEKNKSLFHRFLCQTIIEVNRRGCRHKSKIACHLSNKFLSENCTQKCENKLDCGHPCQKQCFETCNSLTSDQKNKGFQSPCQIMVQKRLNCGHSLDLMCGIDPRALNLLPTSHYDTPCQVLVEKFLDCGHPVELPCGTNLERWQKKCCIQIKIWF